MVMKNHLFKEVEELGDRCLQDGVVRPVQPDVSKRCAKICRGVLKEKNILHLKFKTAFNFHTTLFPPFGYRRSITRPTGIMLNQKHK
jgi:hypothetical protein